MVRSISRGAAVIAGAFMIASVIAAQAAEGPAMLEEIVVTAQKRTESIQKVPVPITAFSANDLAANGMTNLLNIQALVPSMTLDYNYGSISTPKIYMRGIGVDNQVFSFDTPIGLYIDGVYLARITGAMVDLFDVDRIEVLRGPQGTLYGRNSSVGAVSISTMLPPLDKTDFKASATVGSEQQRNAEFTLGLPLIPNELGMRLSFDTRNNNGFQREINSGRRALTDDINAVRGALLYRPSDSFELILRGDYMRDNSKNAVGVNFRNPDLSLNPNVDPYVFAESTDIAPVNEIDPWGLSATINWHVANAVDLTSITAYRHLRYRNAGDVDGREAVNTFEVARQDLDELQVTQEVYLSNKSAGPTDLKWVVGAFYFYERNEFDWALKIFAPPTTEIFKQNTHSLAPYMQVTWPVTDKLSLTAGLRYTYEKKDFGATQLLPDGTPTPNFDFQDSKKANKTNYRVAVDYQAQDNVLLYASDATGFRSGGFNGSAFNLAGISSGAFGPEDSNTAELGIKSDWFGRRLRANLDYFYSKYSNLQQAVTLSNGDITTSNANAKVHGLELELRAVPVDNWQIGLTLSDMHNQIDGSLLDLKQAPKWLYKLSTSYTIPWAAIRGDVRIGADINYSSSYFNDTQNTPSLEVNSYHLWNAHLAYESSDKHWGARLEGLNLGRAFYPVGGFDIAGGFISSVWYPNLPRRVEFTVNYKY